MGFGSEAEVHVSSTWSMFKHRSFYSSVSCSLTGKNILDACAMCGTQLLKQLLLVGLTSVPIFDSHSSFDFLCIEFLFIYEFSLHPP